MTLTGLMGRGREGGRKREGEGGGGRAGNIRLKVTLASEIQSLRRFLKSPF